MAENRYFEGEDSELIANDPNWSHSEFKIFVWIAVVYAAQKSKKISQFVQFSLPRTHKTSDS